MIKRRVNHRVALLYATLKAGQVFDITAMRFGSHGKQSSIPLLRTCQTYYLMACVDQFPSDASANKACGAGYKYAHSQISLC